MKYGKFVALALSLCLCLGTSALAVESDGVSGGDTSPSPEVSAASETSVTVIDSSPAESVSYSSQSVAVDGEAVPGDSANTGVDSAGSDTGGEVDPFAENGLMLYEVAPDVAPGYSTYSLDDSTPAYDSGTMADVIVRVFGEYQPKTQTVTDHLSDGTSVSYEQYVPGAAGVDWQWVSGVCLFALVLWSFFKLLGVFFKNV